MSLSLNEIALGGTDISLSSNDISLSSNDISFRKNDISLSSNDIYDNTGGTQLHIGDISRLLEQQPCDISPIYRSNGNVAQISPITHDYRDKQR